MENDPFIKKNKQSVGQRCFCYNYGRRQWRRRRHGEKFILVDKGRRHGGTGHRYEYQTAYHKKSNCGE